jgi:hypothetical protein
MRYSTERSNMRLNLIYFLIGALLLLLLGVIAKGQSPAQTSSTAKAHAQMQQSLYREYRGVRLGMTATEARAKLGEPSLKSDEQDFYILSANETAQLAYIGGKVVTISTDYLGGIGAPDYRNVVGDGLLQRPDGSTFRMVLNDAERFWVSYNKSATVVPTVTITIGAYK